MASNSPDSIRIPLRKKLTRTTIATLVLVSMAIAGVMSWLNIKTADDNLALLEQQSKEAIRDKGTLLAENHALALKSLAEDNAVGDIKDLVKRTVDGDFDVVYGSFQMADETGWRIVYPSGEDSFWKLHAIPPPAVARRIPKQAELRRLSDTVYEFATPVVSSEGTVLGCIRYGVSNERLEGTLRAARTRARMNLRNTFGLIGLATLAFVLLGTMLSARAARRITEPLLALTSTANEIASGETKVRAVVKSGDELEILASAFNHMLEKQEETFKRLEKTTELALEASRMKDEFLANMSHEIRTPMNGVIGMVQLILGLQVSPMVRRYAEIVDSSAQALMSIINDILDFSKLEAGKYELQNVTYDPRMVTQEVVELYAPRAHAKDLEILCHTTPPFPALVQGDPDRFRQVLSNLVANAVKFTDKGEVFVELSTQACGDDELFVLVKVIDTGIGISSSGLSKLFEAFSQVDGSMVRNHGGTGLGLAISKRIAELMGGQVGVESAVGRGSTFWFKSRVLAVDSRQPIADPIGRRALVIDKNARWRDVLSEHMASWGMVCTTVGSAREAIDCLRRAETEGLPPDVVVLSLGIDDMTTAELVSAIRALKYGAKLPLMMLTQLGAATAIVDSRSEFAAELRKPMRMSELYDQLVGIFTGKRRLASDSKVVVAPRGNGERILVVDDNEINQLVATEMLHEFGYTTDVASNGAIAVAKAKAKAYSAILMDCQMPVMDGYSATRAIREYELGSDRHVPIIALTAHAMVGERERILRAGMDDYLAKPARPRALLKLLNQVLGDKRNGDWARPAAPETESTTEALDGNVHRSARLTRLFLKLAPGQIASLKAAVEQGAIEEVRAAAHKLKGSALSMAAGPMSRLAEKLQHGAENGDLSEGSGIVHELEESYERMETLLRLELQTNAHPVSSLLGTEA